MTNNDNDDKIILKINNNIHFIDSKDKTLYELRQTDYSKFSINRRVGM